MPLIQLQTEILAPIGRCFDLARSLDLHQVSTAHTNEKAVAGKTEGLIGLNEFVTWEATHFGVRQQLTSRITAFQYPVHFCDEMEKGIFKKIKHDHYFAEGNGLTQMRDAFEFESPLGVLGKWANALFLTKYLAKLLVHRNGIIKAYAESEKWKTVLI